MATGLSLSEAVRVLCQVAKSGMEYPEFDDFTACNDTKSYRDIDALWKSALLPGWGQVDKNHKVLGFSIMGIEATLLIASIVNYNNATDDLRKYNERYFSNLEDYNFHRKKYYTLLSAAGVVYALNLVQAYVMKPRYKMDGIALAPVIIPTDGAFATGLGLTFNF